MNNEISGTPKPIFRNRFTYIVYEYSHTWYFQLTIILTLFNIVAGICYNKARINHNYSETSLYTVKIVIVFSSAFTLLFGLITSILNIISRTTNVNQLVKLKFLTEMKRINPGSNQLLWNQLTLNINTFIYNENYWNTPYFFYDKNSAMKYFYEFAINPYMIDLDELSELEKKTSYYRMLSCMTRENLGLEDIIATVRKQYFNEIGRGITGS
ncbi:hypothetical protein TBLA_0B05730 [Henningerozyma blattae CBS 6284]|uniref:Uncharacterized protein n=1 Tax=Henningerozyma blattae (strain ATCC 34711 / CBS 6284 / DSM 70876 / NBRC 10599 / NRRL Y-10934 / UCD 77-7) TaxID=1071380 RepID=I2GZ48_HENB6|nr:hypothetical protein TBLA_0B05730 [Tetrapisispora blattae CBS 6284]CCH59400.1 hypothetical protein TBLA_0B05730 [Tetrapisispora blattae CBS 6284]